MMCSVSSSKGLSDLYNNKSVCSSPGSGFIVGEDIDIKVERIVEFF